MIDVTSFIGASPFDRRGLDAPGLRRLLRRSGVSHSIVSPLPALLHLDPAGENFAWQKELSGDPFFTLAPIVNLSLPGSVEDALASCGTDRVVRVVSGCHAYHLSEHRGQLRVLWDAGAVVIVQMRLRDDRVESRLAPFRDVSIDDLVRAVRDDHGPLIVAGLTEGEIALLDGRLPSSALLFDLSYAEGDRLVRRLIDRYGADRFAAGTNAPVFAPSALAAKLDGTAVTDDERAAVGRGNVLRLLPGLRDIAARPALGTASAALSDRFARVIPWANSTCSKRPRLLPEEPGILVRGDGCRVWDADGREFIDVKSSLGPLVLGHRHPHVDAAIERQLRLGFAFSAPTALEGELAERLVDLVPWAERARFLKTGGEAVAAAIKIARAATSRDHVVQVGYNGWLNAIAADGPALPGRPPEPPVGVPSTMSSLHHSVRWGDDAGLAAVMSNLDRGVAAVVVAAGYPDMDVGTEFLPAVRRVCDEHGAVMVVDEIVTGLRVARAGVSERFGVEPDLAVYAKGLGNGMPIAAYVGRASVMDSLDRAIVTSTNGGEALSLAAAHAVLDVYESDDVVGHLWSAGERLWTGIDDRLKGAPATTAGFAPCRALVADDPADIDRLLRACFANGLILHGVSYVNRAHEADDIVDALSRFDAACISIGW